MSTFDHGYALLIGVGEYIDLRYSLPATVKDIQALHRILIDPQLCAYPDTDQHVRLLYNQGATQQAILEGLGWLVAQSIRDQEATMIVYYSGHGWLDSDSGRYYLLPHDFNFDPVRWQDTALPAETFNQLLHHISAQRLLVILDCCHAAGMATTKGNGVGAQIPKGVVPTAAPQAMIDSLKQGKGRVVFTSCLENQTSWTRPDNTLSLYTHHLIEALQGAASVPGATEVTVFDLANHLRKTVPASAANIGREQNPRFEMETEGFAISLLHGGRGLPEGGWDVVQPASFESSPVQATGDHSVAFGKQSNSNTVTTIGGSVSTGQGDINIGHHYYDSNIETIREIVQELQKIQSPNNFIAIRSSAKKNPVPDSEFADESLTVLTLEPTVVNLINSRLFAIEELHKAGQLSSTQEAEFNELKGKAHSLKVLSQELELLAVSADRVLHEALATLTVQLRELDNVQGTSLLESRARICLKQQIELLEQFQTDLMNGKVVASWLDQQRTEKLAHRLGEYALTRYPQIKEASSARRLEAFDFSIDQFLERLGHCLTWGRTNILEHPTTPLVVDIEVYTVAFEHLKNLIPNHLPQGGIDQLQEYIDYLIQKLSTYRQVVIDPSD